MENVEIERKWLMEGYPPLAAKAELIQEQGYLSFSPAVRIRKVVAGAGTSYLLTLKGKGGMARTEVELPLNEAQFEALRGLLQSPMVQKKMRTYTLPDGHTLECSCVDEGQPESFYYAEVEFDSEEEALRFLPPPFLGTEVTKEPEYTMAAYSRRKAQKAGFGGE
ncbi:hypothetical protein LJC49_09435 [Ruminococcaceae bacterium OttesenSCG-928-I18]|nr:hypothetical protein [Ruminococcaceae bacterium OttesenSCG-928-I18]